MEGGLKGDLTTEAAASSGSAPPGFVRPTPGKRPTRKRDKDVSNGTFEHPSPQSHGALDDSDSNTQFIHQYPTLSAKQVAFLTAYVACGGNITEAAKLAGVHRQNHSTTWIKRPDYAAAFADAHAAACERIEHEIYRRGELGYDEPIVYQGKISKDDSGKPLTVRKYSDMLLIFRAKKFMPEYRDKVEYTGQPSTILHQHEHSGAITVDERRSELLGILLAIRERAGIRENAIPINGQTGSKLLPHSNSSPAGIS